ncbi:MAG: hypothetical protein AAGF88_09020 [Pseudomonadota bacterium]
MDTDQISALERLLSPILASDSSSLVGALLLLLVTSSLALVGKLVTSAVMLGQNWYDYRRRRREALTDIVIYARTFFLNVDRVATPEALAPVRAAIKADPKGYRAFHATIDDEEVYREYKQIRRTLSPEEMSLCDTFFDRARIFRAYYEKLAADEFKELSEERKLNSLDQLIALGERLDEIYVRLRQDGTEFRAMANEIRAERLLPGREGAYEPKTTKYAAKGTALPRRESPAA